MAYFRYRTRRARSPASSNFLEGAIVIRLLKWLSRRMGPRRLIALMLLMVALGSVAEGLVSVIQSLNAGLAWSIITGGVLIGWWLAASPLRGRAAGLLAAISGWGGVLLRIGRLGDEVITLLRAVGLLAWDALRWLPRGRPADWRPAAIALIELLTGVRTLTTRVLIWATTLTAGESAFDPVAATSSWSLALWGVSAWAGWMIRRHNRPLLSLIPATTLLTATLFYARSSSYILLALLGAMLLLLACVGYDTQVNRWRAADITFAELGFDVTLTTFLLSLALVIAAGLSPSFSVRKIVDFMQDLTEQHTDNVEVFAESLGVEQKPDPSKNSVFEEPRDAGLPRRHLLGSGPELSEEVVMVISTGDHPPDLPYRSPQWSAPRYYWQTFTYDQYVYQGWHSSETQVTEYRGGEAAITTTLENHRVVRQEVRVVGDMENWLHVAGTLMAVDRDYNIAWRSHNDIFGGRIEALTYRADSLIPVVSERQLQNAGSDYPEWIQERYLALPGAIPNRVLALARDLTAAEPTPYDRALAIEAYLRNFPYTLDVPEPPPDKDVVDYFLFDLQKGYCDYYATAMVVLARAAGLPARLAVGYATGSYDMTNARYIITKAAAHAWPEIYFPGYRWVRFEPTAGRQSIERPTERTTVEWSEPEETLTPAITRWRGVDWYWWIGGASGFVVLVLASLGWLAIESWRLHRQEPTAAITTLYKRFRRRGRRLITPKTCEGDTPYEFATYLTEQMMAQARKARWGKKPLLPAAQEIHCLVEIYVQTSYSPCSPDAADRSLAIKTWQKLRWRLWLARMREGLANLHRRVNTDAPATWET